MHSLRIWVCYLLLTTLSLTGCASRDIVGYAMKTNLAFEQTQNQLLLLNIVRSYKRRPNYFTALGTFNGSPGISQIQGLLTIPFGKNNGLPYQIQPSLTSTGTSLVIQPLDVQEFVQGFMRPIPGDQLNYYFQQGWSPSPIFHLLVERIEIKENDAVVKRYLNDPLSTEINRFSEIVNQLSFCQIDVRHLVKPVGPPLSADKIATVTDLISLPDGYDLQKADGDYQLNKPTNDVVIIFRKPISGERSEDCETGLSTLKRELNEKPCKELCKAPDEVRVYWGESNTEYEEKPQDTESKKKVVFAMRSPQGVLYYLGEIARAELGEPHQALPEITYDHAGVKGSYPLFEIRKNEHYAAGRALTVTYEGDRYSVPLETAGKMSRNLQVFSLLNLLISSQKSAKELPTTATLRLVP